MVQARSASVIRPAWTVRVMSSQREPQARQVAWSIVASEASDLSPIGRSLPPSIAH